MVNKSLTVIIPIYNEKDIIKKALFELNLFMKQNFNDYELLIIESGSTDGSWELLDNLAAKNNKIKLIHEGKRNGFGSAIKLGYQNASKDYVTMTTVDGPFDIGVVVEAAQLMNKYDCVLSYRSEDPRGLFRKFQSLVYNLIVKTALGLKFKHVNSAFKMFKKNDIDKMKLTSNTWFIDAEILYWVKKLNLKYYELPVKVIDRKDGKSSVGMFSFIDILKELIKFKKI